MGELFEYAGDIQQHESIIQCPILTYCVSYRFWNWVSNPEASQSRKFLNDSDIFRLHVLQTSQSVQLTCLTFIP